MSIWQHNSDKIMSQTLSDRFQVKYRWHVFSDQQKCSASFCASCMTAGLSREWKKCGLMLWSFSVLGKEWRGTVKFEQLTNSVTSLTYSAKFSDLWSRPEDRSINFSFIWKGLCNWSRRLKVQWVIISRWSLFGQIAS